MSIIIKSGSSGNLANVDALGNFSVVSTPAAINSTTAAWTSGTAINAVFSILTTGGYPAIALQLDQTSTLSAGAATFEGTYDGINWVTIPVSQILNPNTFAQLTNPFTFAASTNSPFLILTQGYQQVRVRLSTLITGTGTVTPYWNLLSNNPSGGTVAVSSISGTVTVAGTVAATQSGTWTVRNQDGSGNSLTSTGNALDINLKTSSITLPVSLTSTTVTGTVAVTQSTSPWVVSLGVNPIPAGNNNIGTVNVLGLDQTTSGIISAIDAVVVAPGGGGQMVTGASTAGSLVALNVSGVSAWSMAITGGNFTTTIYFEGSLDSTTGTDGNWVSLYGRILGTTGNANQNNATTNNTFFEGASGGLKYVRFRAVGGTITSGPTITIRAGTVNTVSIGTPLPTGTNVLGHIITDSGSTTAVTGTVAVTQSTSPWVVSLTSTTITGTVAVSGTVTANIGTTGGITVAQASATSGQSGPLMQGAVTTAAPAYTTAQTSPLTLDLAGNLRISATTATSALTSVASSASTVSLLASNASRKGFAVFNESTSTLYLAEAATASITAYTVQITPGGFYESPMPVQTGVISGIWLTANGNARITERT